MAVPRCNEAHCDNRKLQAQCWQVVKGESDVCLQVSMENPETGQKIRAMAPFPVPVWCCDGCGRVEKPTDMQAWASRA